MNESAISLLLNILVHGHYTGYRDSLRGAISGLSARLRQLLTDGRKGRRLYRTMALYCAMHVQELYVRLAHVTNRLHRLDGELAQYSNDFSERLNKVTERLGEVLGLGQQLDQNHGEIQKIAIWAAEHQAAETENKGWRQDVRQLLSHYSARIPVLAAELDIAHKVATSATARLDKIDLIELKGLWALHKDHSESLEGAHQVAALHTKRIAALEADFTTAVADFADLNRRLQAAEEQFLKQSAYHGGAVAWRADQEQRLTAIEDRFGIRKDK